MNATKDGVPVAGLSLGYAIDRDALPAALAARVLELEHDDAAADFVAEGLGARHGGLRTAAYRLLRRTMSDYDAYGLLGMYPMHLLSTPQAARLLRREPARPARAGSPHRAEAGSPRKAEAGSPRKAEAGEAQGQTQARDVHRDAQGSVSAHGSLLDVGAGNGSVTAALAPLFERVCVTEASHVMRRVLARRGLCVMDWDLTRAPPPRGRDEEAPSGFDVVACLNVLDRCARPRSLLSNARAALATHGRLLLSVPLPLSPHVHVGAETIAPEEPLPAPSDGWEAGAASLVDALFTPAGLGVRSLSRAPYLCRGDASRPLYVLDAAVFVLEG